MQSRFQKKTTKILGVVVIERQPISDERGWFERLFCADELAELTGGQTIKQVNRSVTHRRGAVRGLHYQHPPHAEIKIVTCLRGEVFDVAVDVRQDSTTFLQWHSERLTANNKRMLVIPKGCAHGFQTLTDNCELLYFHTSEYMPDAEAALQFQDKKLAITLPLPITEISDRDCMHPLIDTQFKGLKL